MASVHDLQQYKISPQGEPPPGYPGATNPDSFRTIPNQADFSTRRQAYLAHILRNPAPPNTKAAYYELARIAAGGKPHIGVMQAALDFIDARQDCADFVLHAILRLLYQFPQGAPGSENLVPEFYQRAKASVLGFKYWPDEPGIDSMCTWTENHYILFTTAAYLAGQLYPEQTFTNSGQTGQQKILVNRPRILRWLALRFRTGFSEWLSHVYYDEDLTALLALVDFCQDEELAQKSKMVVDLLLLDLALNSFRGVFGSSHGRSYANTKKWASNEGTSDTAKLLFGMGQYSAFDNMSAPVFALSHAYQLPPVLEVIAQDVDRPSFTNRQRMGIRLKEAERWGLGFDSLEDGMVYLTLEAYTHPRTIALTMRMFDAFHWWENAFFAPFKPYRRLLAVLRRLGLLGVLARVLERDVCRNTREQVNLITYRTPDYMLSCAQDYRPGYGGDQQHIWQATLAPDTVCFTTHPAQTGSVSPNEWTGSGLLPRAAQVENVALIIYKIEAIPALYVPTRLFYTHAWFPKDRFDEVIEQQGWVLGRKGDGYLALRSMQPYRWQTAPGQDQHREIIADGSPSQNTNIWVCEMGRRAVDGDFNQFVAKICAARLEFEPLSLRYGSPSQGLLEFGWSAPLRREGKEILLSEYLRYDNPYVREEFPAGRLALQAGKHRLLLDWQNQRRETSL